MAETFDDWELSEQPMPLPIWTILYADAKVRWTGEVEARDEHDALVKAAQQFKLPAAKLIVARRR